MARGRPPSLTPSRSINTHLDESLMCRLDTLLFSELEGRVPKGAYQRFFNQILRHALDQCDLDLAPYTGDLPSVSIVRGSPEVLAKLQALLESKS